MRNLKTFAAGVALLLAPWIAVADDSTALEQQGKELEQLSLRNPMVASRKVADHFDALAGSEDNADRLVAGLRSGSEVELRWVDSAGDEVTTVLTPETGKMGLGNVFIALALAEESLRQGDVEEPTPALFAEALAGILEKRADGGGWGRIAKDMGVKLGPVVSAIRSENGRLRAEERRASAGTKGLEKAAKGFERAAKVERPGRPERPAKPDHPSRG